MKGSFDPPPTGIMTHRLRTTVLIAIGSASMLSAPHPSTPSSLFRFFFHRLEDQTEYTIGMHLVLFWKLPLSDRTHTVFSYVPVCIVSTVAPILARQTSHITL